MHDHERRDTDMDDAAYRRYFGDLPELKTERLTLRKLRVADVYDVNAYASREEVAKYLLWTPHLNLQETKGYLEYLSRRYRKGLHADWGVALRESGRIIGTCGVEAVDLANDGCELGYVLSPDYWGKGYMDEAFEAVLDEVFGRLGAHRAALRILEGNRPSEAFALRHGFRFEGASVRSLWVKGAYRTVRHYALLADERRK